MHNVFTISKLFTAAITSDPLQLIIAAEQVLDMVVRPVDMAVWSPSTASTEVLIMPKDASMADSSASSALTPTGRWGQLVEEQHTNTCRMQCVLLYYFMHVYSYI